MRLYCADIRDANEKKAILPGRRPTAGSAFGVSLLSYAAKDFWGAEALPSISETDSGRPYFPEWPDRHFSISHTKTHVLVAVSGFPVGADIEARRSRSESLILKLMDERERADFEFFELWVLRESLFKLTGKGDLRKMRFARESGEIVPPVSGARCRLFNDVPGCAAAVSCFEGVFPESIIMVGILEICS
ncbi:MAG: hypothetical protein EOM54_05080 [Clostridia bacterium]|nr:hypothetical protein [Clostridia bacterium]